MQSVIDTGVQSLFYNNNIECQHFREKLEQSYKKVSLETVILTLQKLVERQENDKNKTIYAIKLKQFTDLAHTVWASSIPNLKLIQWSGIPSLVIIEGNMKKKYVKSKKIGKKPSDGGKRIRKQQETEVIVGRHAKRIRIVDPKLQDS